MLPSSRSCYRLLVMANFNDSSNGILDCTVVLVDGPVYHSTPCALPEIRSCPALPDIHNQGLNCFGGYISTGSHSNTEDAEDV